MSYSLSRDQKVRSCNWTSNTCSMTRCIKTALDQISFHYSGHLKLKWSIYSYVYLVPLGFLTPMGFRASHVHASTTPCLLVISTFRAWRLEAERRPCLADREGCRYKSVSEFRFITKMRMQYFLLIPWNIVSCFYIPQVSINVHFSKCTYATRT